MEVGCQIRKVSAVIKNERFKEWVKNILQFILIVGMFWAVSAYAEARGIYDELLAVLLGLVLLRAVDLVLGKTNGN